jgi:hypothetical protein
MSPDWSAEPEAVPCAMLVDPQTLNLYTYVRNNPLNRIDPTGHYLCRGTRAQCQAIADGLAQARAALQGKNLSKEERDRLAKVVSSFGKAWDERDGVTITFGKTTSLIANADSHSWKDQNGIFRTDIKFNSAVFDHLSIVKVGGVLVHERQHGFDGAARGGFDPRTRKAEFSTKVDSYNIESYVPKGLGVNYQGLWDTDPSWQDGSRIRGALLGAISSTKEWCRLYRAPGC